MTSAFAEASAGRPARDAHTEAASAEPIAGKPASTHSGVANAVSSRVITSGYASTV